MAFGGGRNQCPGRSEKQKFLLLCSAKHRVYFIGDNCIRDTSGASISRNVPSLQWQDCGVWVILLKGVLSLLLVKIMIKATT